MNSASGRWTCPGKFQNARAAWSGTETFFADAGDEQLIVLDASMADPLTDLPNDPPALYLINDQRKTKASLR